MMFINWVGVTLSILAVFAIGGLWYGPLFGKAWVNANGLTPDMAPKGGHRVMVFAGAGIAGFVAACALGVLVGPVPDLMRGVNYGLVVGIAFVTMSFTINYLFANRSYTLLLIDGGYNIVLFVTMGAIFGGLG